MSQAPEVAQALSALLSQAPKNATGPASGIWDDLVSLISNAVRNIINSANSTISGWIDGARNAIKSKIDDVKGWLETVGGQIYKYLFDANTGVVHILSDKINGVVQGVIDGVNKTLGSIGDAIAGAIGKVVSAISNVVDAIKGIGQDIANAISGVVDSIGQWIANAVADIGTAIGAVIKSVVDTVSGWIREVYTNIADFIKNFAQGLTNTIQAVKDGINNTINAVKDWIGNIYNTVKQTVEEIFQKFLDWLAKTVINLVNWYGMVKGNVLHWYNGTFLPHLQESKDALAKFGKGISPILAAIESGNYQLAFDKIDSLLTDIGIDHPIHVLWSILSMAAYWAESIRLQFVPMEVAASKRAMIGLAMEPIDISLAHEAVDRELMTEAEFIDNARLAGINAHRAKIANEAQTPLAPPELLKQLFLRGEISEKAHDTILKHWGYETDTIKGFKAVYHEIPPITDLVHFADRWAWDDKIAARFLYDTEFPEIVNDWAAKIGLSSEWFKRYWRSHWQLPSLQDIFEMFHRLRPGEVKQPFDGEDLNAYLLTTPLPPYFHELLKEITYLPLTRVDIRRMYKVGVLNDEQVYKAYLDLGYDDTNAKRLADFTKKNYTPEDTFQRDEFFSQARIAYSAAYKHSLLSRDEYKSMLIGLGMSEEDGELLASLDDYAIQDQNQLFDLLTQRKNMRSLVLNAYNEGIIDVKDASDVLTNLGEDQDQINLELSVMDYNKGMQDRQTLIDLLHDQFVGNMIDETGLHTITDMFNFNGQEIDLLISRWNVEKAYRTKRPSLTDLKRFMTQKIISVDEFLDELRGEGYHEKYIQMYAKSLALQAAG